MAAVDLRRSAAAASAAAPGKDATATAAASADAAGGSSGPSSGIGSDHAPSPDRQSDPRFLDNGDSSDEDWNDQPSEDSLLVAGGWDLSLPRARRHGATTTTASTPTSGLSHGHVAHDHHPHIQPHTHYPPPAVAASPPRRARQRSPSPGPLSPRDRFKDAKEKFLLLEREELTRRHDVPPPASPPPPAPAPSSASLPERGGGGGGSRARLWSRASDDDLEDRYYAQPPLPHPGQHQRYEHLDDSFDHPDASFSYHQPPAQARRAAAYRHHPQEEEVVRRYRSQSPLEERGRPRRRGEAPAGAAERMLSPRPAPRQHAPPPEDAYRPPRHHQPPTHHPHHQATSEHSYDGRHPAADIPLHRYRSPGRSHGPAPLSAAPAPSPAPAPAPAPRHRDASPLGDAYSPPRGGGGYDKRRSMFDVLEDERRRNSNELAREFKRRSYQDAPGMSMSQYQELADHERFPGLDRETARLNHHSAMVAAAGGGGSAPRRGGGGPPPMGPPGGGYRHSYAEGALPLHRTNSSVSSGRVGLAAVHPY